MTDEAFAEATKLKTEISVLEARIGTLGNMAIGPDDTTISTEPNRWSMMPSSVLTNAVKVSIETYRAKIYDLKLQLEDL